MVLGVVGGVVVLIAIIAVVIAVVQVSPVFGADATRLSDNLRIR